MFEVLTEAEAQTLDGMLADGYRASKALAMRMATAYNGSLTQAGRNSQNARRNAQAAMRAEITSLRWQIQAEALS